MGEARSCVEMAGGCPKTRFSTPDGIPASARQATIAAAALGASSGALRMTGQPAARAGPSLRAVITAGKFQGTNAGTTPAGSGTTTREPSPEGTGALRAAA